MSALDQLHGQERPAVGQGAEVVDGGDAGVLELAGDAGLVREPAGGRGVGREPVLEDLDRHLSAERRVAGPVDDAHPAAGDLVLQFVAAPRSRGRLRPPAPARDGADVWSGPAIFPVAAP